MDGGATLVVDTSFLGDVLCAEPLVRAAAERFAGPVDFLTVPAAAGMLEGHPAIRELLLFDKRGADRGIGGLWRCAAALRRRGYARAVCSHRSWRTALLLWLARIPRRIGFDNAAGSWLYSERAAYRRDLHEVQRNLELLGGGPWQRPRLFPDAAERLRAAEWTPAGPFVAIAPGSLWATKRWPEQHYAKVVEALAAQGVAVVLLGGKADFELCQRLASSPARERQGQVVNLCGRTTLRESYAVLERAAVLLSNDSAPMHLGVAAGIPVVAVFCSTLPAFGFAPRGAGDLVLEVAGLDCRSCGVHGRSRCPLGHFRCGWEVRPEVVLAALRQRLDLPCPEQGSERAKRD